MPVDLSLHRWDDTWILLDTPGWRDVWRCTCGVYNCRFTKQLERLEECAKRKSRKKVVRVVS